MNDGAKQAYLDKMTAQLREWSAKVDVVKAKVAQGAADIRIDYHNQIESWQGKESVFKEKIEELRLAGADGYESIKSGVQKTWNELTALVSTLEGKKE